MQEDTYNNKGQLIERYMDNDDGSFGSYFACEYDGKLEKKTTHYNADGSLKHYIVYDYSGNHHDAEHIQR